MRGTILQPGYFPWLGFFNQMILSDVFVFLDDVQFDRRGWRNRNRIKTPNGETWLTVPVVQRGKFDQNLLNTEIDNSQKWKRKHLRSIEFSYRTSEFFKSIYPKIESVLSRPIDNLVELDIALVKEQMDIMEISEVEVQRSSSLNITNMDKTGRLVEICVKLGITEYISGPLCVDYLELKQFSDAGIQVFLHNYKHPVYNQLYGDFLPYMATIDLLFNELQAAKKICRQPEALVDFRDYQS